MVLAITAEAKARMFLVRVDAGLNGLLHPNLHRANLDCVAADGDEMFL